MHQLAQGLDGGPCSSLMSAAPVCSCRGYETSSGKKPMAFITERENTRSSGILVFVFFFFASLSLRGLRLRVFSFFLKLGSEIKEMVHDTRV